MSDLSYKFINPLVRHAVRMIRPLLIVLLVAGVAFCRSAESKNRTLLANCVDTFGDKEKCSQMLGMDVPAGIPAAEAEGENNSQLYDRGMLKNILKGKNRLFVTDLLGEPDKKVRISSREIWIYNRPVSRDRKSGKPDRQVRLDIRKGAVLSVDVKK